MKTSTTIHVVTRFEGFHRWADAPLDVVFLRAFHRHVFNVRVYIPVTHDNRQVEFFQFKRKLDDYIKATLEGRQFELSCEQIAKLILETFPEATAVEVREDEENGAIVERV